MPQIEFYHNGRMETLNVDIRAELEEYEWNGAKWSHDKLIAASPFRYDKTPSFFVRLEPYGEHDAGVWGDSGAYDVEWAKGGFAKLLSFLRHETETETKEYLLDKYGRRGGGVRKLILPHLHRPKTYQPLPETLIDVAVSPYLTKRGISAGVQLAAGVGKSEHRGFVAIPWRTLDGRLMNVKYRATRGKAFFYEDDAYPIRRLVWGVESVKDAGIVILTEAEIDALSWRTAGINAIAAGGVSFDDEKADIIRRLDAERVILGGDNDKAGRRFNAQVARMLYGKVPLGVLQWGSSPHKDANDVLLAEGVEGLRELAEKIKLAPRFKAPKIGYT